MKRISQYAGYAAGCGLCLITLFIAACFLSGYIPQSIDARRQGTVSQAILYDAALLATVGLAWTAVGRIRRRLGMALPSRRTGLPIRVAPAAAVLAVCWHWQPIGGLIWNVESDQGRLLLYALFAVGCLIVAVTTVASVLVATSNREPRNFCQRVGARISRSSWAPTLHCLGRGGWLIAVGVTPTMTVAHLALAASVATYILLLLPFRVHDLEGYYRAVFAGQSLGYSRG